MVPSVLTLVSPEQNATGTALIKAKLPGTLRADLKDPLGRAVLSFFTDAQIVEALFPRENKLFQGPATPTNLAAFIPPGVKVDQALRLMVGGEERVSRFRDSAHEIQGLIAIEWRDLDGDDIGNFDEAPPEVER